MVTSRKTLFEEIVISIKDNISPVKKFVDREIIKWNTLTKVFKLVSLLSLFLFILKMIGWVIKLVSLDKSLFSSIKSIFFPEELFNLLFTQSTQSKLETKDKVSKEEKSKSDNSIEQDNKQIKDKKKIK